MDKKTSGSLLNISSLVDLKAELIRKQKEAQLDRLRDVNLPTQGKLGPKLCESLSKIKSNIKPKSKSQSQQPVSYGDEDDELEKKLSESRSKLEAKACLYDKMCEGTLSGPDELQKIYLVDFERKSHQMFDDEIRNGPPRKENDWVEYEDGEGQVRHCKQSDLDWAAAKDSKEGNAVHYQNVLGDEIWSHGVGYYAFSKREEERRKQQEEFRNMRDKTEREMKKRKVENMDKTSKMEARLAKVRERKRLRAGLPLCDEEPEDKAQVQNETVSDIPVPETVQFDIEKDKQEKLEREKDKSYLNLKSVRPWDVEKLKTILPVSLRDKLLSEDEYQERERQKRRNEFAPPSLYDARSKHKNITKDDSSNRLNFAGIESAVHIRLQQFRKQSDKQDIQ